MPVATAPTLRSSTVRKGDPGRDRRGLWPRRSQWLSGLSTATMATPGARSLGLVLADRSDENGKPVYGTQVNLAVTLGVSVATVQRGVSELEGLGLVRVERHKPERGEDGRWFRRLSNVYHFVVRGRRPLLDASGGRRRPKAGYCAVKGQVRPTRQPCSHNPDETEGLTPPPSESVVCEPETGEILEPTSPEEAQRRIRQVIAEMFGKKS